MLDRFIEFDDSSKVRKSLLSVAIATLFIANIDFSSESLNFFGLKIFVKHSRVVAFGQIASGALLFIFFIRAFPGLLNAFDELSQKYVTRRETQETNNYMEKWQLNPPPEQRDGIEGDHDELSRKYSAMRTSFEKTFAKLRYLASALAVVLLDYGMPVGVGLAATKYPYAVSELVDAIAVQQPPNAYTDQ